ncbi:MAG: hypothetical protein SOX32_09210 [Candidatus Choladocola sp.]|nr:hypothetical protein [Candidatus Choladocola sp.]
MGFMDYIQKIEGRRFGWNGSGLRLKMPMVNVLLGEFDQQEIQVLRDTLASHINPERKIFWIGCREYGQDFQYFSVPCSEKYGFDQREALQEYGSISGRAALREQLLELAGKIFNETMRESFRDTGCIRLNLFVKPDESFSGLLVPVCTLLEETFHAYYDVQILKDLYLMADQRAYDRKGKDRRASDYLTLVESEQLMGDGQIQLAYFLSNIDNTGRLRSGNLQERYAAPALLMLIKTAIPDKNAGVTSYSDESFGDAVASRNIMTGMTPGKLSSVGYMRLENNEQLATLAACRSVWQSLCCVRELPYEEFLDEIGCGAEGLAEFTKATMPHLRFSEADWQAIVRNRSIREERLMTMTKGASIDALYGRNLDLYLELNCRRGDTVREKLQIWSSRFQELVWGLGRSRRNLNPFEIDRVLVLAIQSLEERREMTAQLYRGQQSKLERWRNSRFGEISRKRVSVTKESFIYVQVADEYLKLRWSVEDARRREKVYAEMLRFAENLRTRLQPYLELVEKAAGELSKEIGAVINNGMADTRKRLQVINGDQYYQAVTGDILQNDKAYRYLQSDLFQMAAGGVNKASEEKIYERVFTFCREHILQDGRFHQECLGEIFARLQGYREEGKDELKTTEDISDFVLQSIDECRHYMCRDSFGGQDCHEEMCFLLDGDSIFAEMGSTHSIAADLIRSDKLRLFCENEYSSLDILFLAGNIRTETLYQFGDYKRAYEECAKER